MSSSVEIIPSDATTMELSKFAPARCVLADVPQLPPLPSRMVLLQELHVQIRDLDNPLPVSPPLDCSDGACLSRPRNTSYAVTASVAAQLGHDRHIQEAERYSFSDENGSGGKGQLTMNPITGLLGVLTSVKTGEVFSMEHKGWIMEHGEKKGWYFSLRSSSNPLLYFAVDGSSPDLTVRGMRLGNLQDISDSYWTFVWLPHDYIALKYWGNRFVDPSKQPYYFVIKLKDKVQFTIGSEQEVAQYGALAVNPH